MFSHLQYLLFAILNNLGSSAVLSYFKKQKHRLTIMIYDNRFRSALYIEFIVRWQQLQTAVPTCCLPIKQTFLECIQDTQHTRSVKKVITHQCQNKNSQLFFHVRCDIHVNHHVFVTKSKSGIQITILLEMQTLLIRYISGNFHTFASFRNHLTQTYSVSE